jgi:hypothetical protein
MGLSSGSAMGVQNGNRTLRQRPVGELMKQLAEETGMLLRQEVALAKSEMLGKIEAVRDEASARASAVRHDLDAVKEELAENGKQAGIGAGMLAGAAVFGLIALGVLAALLARVLAAVLPSALALALVFVLYVAVGAILVAGARKRLRAAAGIVPKRSLSRLAGDVTGASSEGPGLDAVWPPVPKQTTETLKEDVEWLKHPTRSGGR